MQTELNYIELKTGHSDDGPAWIAHVAFSKTGRTVYFNGRELRRWNGVSGNHVDAQTGEEYWISGVKKSGTNRHPCGRGKIMVQRDALADFLAWTGQENLDTKLYEIVD
ncbi:MAG: mannose-1-phosphate guanylyltransferase [Firmicutes bacterium]|nr:mannose-1-phosphate guanylyltransferase [Bacillota bacterium]